MLSPVAEVEELAATSHSTGSGALRGAAGGNRSVTSSRKSSHHRSAAGGSKASRRASTASVTSESGGGHDANPAHASATFGTGDAADAAEPDDAADDLEDSYSSFGSSAASLPARAWDAIAGTEPDNPSTTNDTDDDVSPGVLGAGFASLVNPHAIAPMAWPASCEPAVAVEAVDLVAAAARRPAPVSSACSTTWCSA